jgi:hypothetical protein
MKGTAWKVARLAVLTAATFAVSHSVALPQASACAVCKDNGDCGREDKDGSTGCKYSIDKGCEPDGDPCFYIEG